MNDTRNIDFAALNASLRYYGRSAPAPRPTLSALREQLAASNRRFSASAMPKVATLKAQIGSVRVAFSELAKNSPKFKDKIAGAQLDLGRLLTELAKLKANVAAMK